MRSLLLPVVAGLVLLAAGLAFGAWVLPEGQAGPLPARERFARRYAELLRRNGVEPISGAPRVRLATPGEEGTLAYRRLGEGAHDWLARDRRGLQVEVTQRARWANAEGHLQLTFTANGATWGAVWMPTGAGDFFDFRAPQLEPICGLLLRSGESVGEALPWFGGQGMSASVVPIAGPGPPQHLFRMDPAGSTIVCYRRPGPARAGLVAAQSESSIAAFVHAIPTALLLLASVILFVVLALRGRIDLSNAAVLAVLYLVTALIGNWPGTNLTLLLNTFVPVALGVWLLVLWAAAESWARVYLPGFTTSLDTLRRGRLGEHGGRALVLGWGAGAALAGMRVALLAAAALAPGASPAGTAANLPLFDAGDHPLRVGVTWTAALLLALTAGERMTGRAAVVLAPLVAGLVVSPAPLSPWGLEVLAAVALSAALAWVFRRWGLTSTLVAAVLAYWLPSAALALCHADWVPTTAVIGALGAVLPLALGFVGMRRGPEVERDPGAVPEFLRREEREKRLSYEMDLLARMQLGLLPQSLPRLPGYELTARSILATEAGGDLYDFLRDDRGRLWIAAGDVSGHGYSCAIAQASLKASLLSLVDGSANPARVLTRIDRVLRGIVAGRQFATLALLCLEEATGRVVLANAGHPFPLLAEPGKGAREIELPGLPLGQGPPRRYRDHELQLERGAVLLLHSDGLFEALDPSGRPFGFDRPRQVLSEAASWNAAEILERLLWDWRRHLGGAAPPDDTTLVVLKRG